MALPTSRLDVYLVPHDQTASAVDAARERAASIQSENLPIRAKRIRVDDPGAVVLYANQVGGFQVRCTRCGAGLARVFRPLGHTPCPSCGVELAFSEVECRPPAALGRAAVVLCDVDEALLEDPAGWRVVWRRV